MNNTLVSLAVASGEDIETVKLPLTPASQRTTTPGTVSLNVTSQPTASYDIAGRLYYYGCAISFTLSNRLG